MKARILLKADASEASEGWSDNQIIEALETSASMVYRVRKQLVEEGLKAVLSRKPRAAPAVPRIFDGEKEGKLIALACSQPPKGRAPWTLRLLENKVVELNIANRAATARSGGLSKKHSQAASEAANSAFVAAMEVLAVYTRPRDPDIPLVCLDETSKQLIVSSLDLNPRLQTGRGFSRFLFIRTLEAPRRGLSDFDRGQNYPRQSFCPHR
jgi:Homeodomain-like domain